MFKTILKEKIDQFNQEGIIQTNLEEVVLVKLSKPVPKTSTILPPGICLVSQGEKDLYLGSKKFTYNEETFLLGSVRVPIYAELKTASKKKPYYAMAIFLNNVIISELLLEFDQFKTPYNYVKADGLITTEKATEDILEPVSRLVKTIGNPKDEKILAPLYIKEIYYRILESKAGPFLINAAIQHTKAHQIAPIIHFLEHRLNEEVSIEDLVKQSGMSASSLYECFKEATTLSPMQYLKRLRLNNAHQLLLSGFNVSEAATNSGYNSTTQFAREFKRLFGYSPRDTVTMKSGNP